MMDAVPNVDSGGIGFDADAQQAVPNGNLIILVYFKKVISGHIAYSFKNCQMLLEIFRFHS
jgi:hypothetical protein